MVSVNPKKVKNYRQWLRVRKHQTDNLKTNTKKRVVNRGRESQEKISPHKKGQSSFAFV